jgi:hypothetical protein
MTEVSTSYLADRERAELETVLTDLARKHRLATLLRYLAEKTFEGKSNEINEYNIATEVFGRSKTQFDSTEDAIARVEAHRLRKWLQEYYRGEGKEHSVVISLPTGSYIPAFTERRFAAPLVSDPAPLIATPQVVEPPSRLVDDALATVDAIEGNGADNHSDQESDGIELPANENGGAEEIVSDATEFQARSPERRNSVKRRHLFSALVVLVVLGLAGLWLIQHRQSSASGQNAQHPEAKHTPISANAAVVPLRIIAGYSGPPIVDSTGMRWEPDQYVHQGGTVQRAEGSIERTSDPMLFNHWRNGYFFYDIPLAPGVYELHLYFTATERDLSTFRVVANGNAILDGFDIAGDAGGPNLADERIFRDISPDKDGHLHLEFQEQQGRPFLNAIALLPGIPHEQAPIRIVTQPTPVTDHNGIVWHPDTYFVNGHAPESRFHVEGTADPDLYAGERFGNFSYAIPVDTRDRYTVVLHFAELYFGTEGSGGGAPGERVFRVFCNGSTLLDNFDLYKEAGSLHAVTKTFYHLRPSPQGKLNLTFESIVNNATVSAIEVIDESE